MPADPARVQAAFLAAADLPDPAERAALLARECGTDAEFRARVEALLKAHDNPDSLLDLPLVTPPGGEATSVLPAADGDVTRTQVPTDPDATADPRVGHADADEALAFLKPSARPGSLGRLDHYEVLEVVGSGGFGTVMKAFDTRLHRVVAVKVLAPQLAASGAARARFYREAKSAAAVKDDHVVNIHAVSDDDAPVPYLVMEFVAGQTLQGKLDKAGPLPPKEVLRVGMQAARGLAAAHAQGLVHRDIKPANVLLENGVERVKITDFGLARAADDASLSQSGVVAGTPMYMSPEQARGDTLDTRSDLFSLGSVLYVLCTGRPPFRAETTLAVLKRVVEDDPRPVRDVNPEVPRWLADVVAKLHAKNPADRFQTAKEVAELLAGYLAELQQQGTVVSRVAAPPRPRKRWRWARAAAVGCVLLLAAVPVVLVGLGLAFPLWQRIANGPPRLAPQSTTLAVRVDDPAVEYQLDGRGPIQTGLAFAKHDLAPGQHTVWFRHAGREFESAPFTLAEGQRSELELSAAGTSRLDGRPLAVAPPKGSGPPPAVAPLTPEQAKAHQEAWAAHLGLPVEFAHPSGVAFRLIPPGEFSMGFNAAELDAVRKTLQGLPNVGEYQRFAAESSGPRHTVRITRPFYLAKYETTAGQFQRFLGATKHTPTGTIDWTSFVTPGQEERQPVVGVSWDDATAFCRWLGAGYELPSEAQWEYAARGGGRGLWSFGNDSTKLLDHGVFGQAWPKPGPVGQKAPNPFGLFDVHGGVDEWCRDWHVRDFYRRSPIDDPVNLDEPTDPGTGRASRGGSWNAAAVYSEVAFRAFDNPTRPAMPKGFRVALIGDLKAAVDAARTAADGFVPLFNGRDLTGWKTHPAQPGGWAVEDGVLVGRGTADSHLFTERGDYADFHLRAEVMISRDGDGGITFRHLFGVRNDPPLTPQGFEANINFAQSHKTGSLWVSGLALAGPKSSLVQPDRWFTFEVIARGDHVTLKVNGATTADYTNTAYPFKSGHLALQLAVVPPATSTVIRFRKVEIKELSPLAEPGWLALFNGRDLTGLTTPQREAWKVQGGVLTANGPVRLDAAARAGDAHYRVELKATKAPTVVLAVGSPAGLAAQVTLTTDGKAGGVHRTAAGKEPPLAELPAGLLRPDEWATVEVAVRGAELTVRVDGKDVGRATVPGLPAERAVGVSVPLGTLHVRRFDVKQQGPAEPPWVPLFNGRDLTGWVARAEPGQPPERPWEVREQEGILTARGAPNGYLRTEKAYRHYTFEAEIEPTAKLTDGKGPWAGDLLFGVPDPEPAFPKLGGVRVQVVPGGSGSVGKDGAAEAVAWPAFRPGWNRLTVESGPDGVTGFLNGERVFTHRGADAGAGYIGIVSAGTGLRYRNVRIRPAAPQPGALVLPADGPPGGVYAALARARRERVAAAEKELAAAKARFEAGRVTRREVAEAEAALIEAKLDGAPGAAAVRLLGQLVEKHGTRREVAAARVAGGIQAPAALDAIDADIAKAKARLAEAKLAVPPPAAAPFTADRAKAHQEAWARHLGVPPEVSNDLGMTFRVVPAGSFLMGSTPAEVDAVLAASPDLKAAEAWIQDRVRSEAPARKVTVTEPFLLGTHEVTVGQFREFVKATGYKTHAEKTGGGAVWDNAAKTWGQDPEAVWHNPKYAPGENHPVTFLNPADARAFCAWLGKQDGRTYALPTEEQWEFACRAGTATRWWFGDDPAGMKEHGWTVEVAAGKHRPVGQKAGNPFGLFDLHGNATEMAASPQGEVYERGGQANETAWRARSAWRNPVAEDSRPHGRRGFRVAVVGDPAPPAERAGK